MFRHAVWHNPDGNHTKHRQQLKVIQNRCLCTITGAFKATPTRVLEAEARVMPIDIYLNYRQAQTREWLQNSNQTQVIQEACRKIRDSLHGKCSRRKTYCVTPGERKNKWAKQVLQQAAAVARRHLDQGARPKSDLQQHFQNTWQQQWEEYRQKAPPD